MDIDKLLRTYLHLNDPKYEGITYKFAGAFLILALALGISFWAGSYYDAPDQQPLATETGGNDGGDGASGDDGYNGAAAGTTYSAYVGIDPEQFDPTAFDPDRPDAMLAQWKANHPDAEVLTETAVSAPGQPDLVIGYQLTYR